jgi:hypothetical protein
MILSLELAMENCILKYNETFTDEEPWLTRKVDQFLARNNY